jgi:acyl-coenzyme A thioesterase PaaI-like protein
MCSREPAPPNPDFVETTKRFLMEMPIARHFGFAITDVGPGRFEITQPFREELSFSRGISRLAQ